MLDPWQVSEGSGQHDYAENFDNYSDGIEEVPEVDSEGEDTYLANNIEGGFVKPKKSIGRLMSI